MYATPLTGLVLGGGGARAAYQVGVLNAIAALRRENASDSERRRNPFGVICGTSAGAINAAALACSADSFDDAVAAIVRVWRDFHAEQVYRADSLGVIRTSATWLTLLSLGWLIARWRRARPRSLLNNTPLARLLEQLVPLDRLPRMLQRRHLQALAVTASSYTSGEHFTFYEAAFEMPPWTRQQRLAMPVRLRHEHLLASAAIPEMFRAVHIGKGIYWDGLFSQNPPIRGFLSGKGSRDAKPDEIWVIQINPERRAGEPMTANDIHDRRNELAGNLSLHPNVKVVAGQLSAAASRRPAGLAVLAAR